MEERFQTNVNNYRVIPRSHLQGISKLLLKRLEPQEDKLIEECQGGFRKGWS